MEALFNLVYASTAAKPFSDHELLEWLRAYREKNVRLGITGLLLYKHGSFMQALEGDETAVRALYETIRADDRHHHVLTLVAMRVSERQFPDWSMGFESLDHVDISGVPGSNAFPYLPRPDDELSWQASVALSLLATFVHAN